jgi:Tfp pilus assembly protein PilX
MRKIWPQKPNDRGWFLISAIVMIMFLTLIGVTIAALVAQQYRSARREEYVQNAQLTAEAGIEQSVNQLNSNNSFGGYSTPQTFFNDTVQGKGVFTTSVATNSAGTIKTITSIGEVYRTSSDTTPYITRGVKVTVVGTSSTGFSVYTGPGGLIMSGNAVLTNTNVYVSGTIAMSGNAQIGTYSQPSTVDVGNYACPNPPDSTYPSLCSSSQPIIFNSSNPIIYGSVCANGQTSTGPNNNIQTGNGGQGLETSCPTVSYNPPPTYDRMAQVDAVNSDNIQSGSNACNGSTWNANSEFTGNVSLTGSCNITINGNVYITGNLSISGSSTLKVADTLGSTKPVVLVDGTITVNGSAQMIANSSGTGIEFITFKSANDCTTSNTSYCSSLTGTDLYNSQTETNISVSGQVNLPGMIFDAYWSEVKISGTGNLGAATGQTVYLDGGGSVLFGTVLASGTQTWAITSYEPYYPNG